MTEPTQEQIDKAQQAGNAAYENCTGSLIDASFAYRAAYDATLKQLQQATAEVGVTAKWMPAHTPTDAEYESMSAGLPDGIIDHDDWNQGAWK